MFYFDDDNLNLIPSSDLQMLFHPAPKALSTRLIKSPLPTMELSYPIPHLPSELVIHILEVAARDSQQAAKAISLVATWAREIAVPHVYSTLVYRTKPAFSAGMSSGAKDSLHARSRRPQAWGHLVHNLWTESTGISNALNEAEIFHACPNIENLALKSQSLRAFAPSIRAQTPARRMTVKGRLLSSSTPFQPRLRSMTIITHTFRYDWHFLVGLQLQDGSELLHNITHLRILDMTISSFSPHNLLPNLTYLALPYLDLGNDFKQNALRLPPGVLEHRSLRMIVLTVAEEKWLTNPWYHIARYPGKASGSPRSMLRTLAQWARKRDDRLHVVLSPRLGDDPCEEWANAARGGPSLWEIAARTRAEDSYGIDLPDTFPKGMQR